MYRCLFILLLGCNRPADKKEISHLLVNKTISDTVLQKPLLPEKQDTALYNFSGDEIQYRQISVGLKMGDTFLLKIPGQFKLSVAAEGLGRLRFLAISPDNRLFATDMFDRSDNRKGRVLIFDKWDSTSKTFGSVITYLSGLRNPNQVAFYKNYLYVAETDKLSRYVYMPGDISPTNSPERIAVFPGEGLGYKYGGWHLTRSIAIHHEKLYISVGSSCNACIEKEEIRAAVIEMNPDGTGATIYARGLRNSVGLKWLGNQLWATSMGRDLIGPDKPEDLFHEIRRDGFYGWPFYFQYQNKILADKEFKDSTRTKEITEPPVGFCGFKAHSAPLGFDYFKNFDDPILGNSILVCLHGSTSVWRQRGNSIVKVGKGNKYTEIISGFLSGKNESDRHGRPCDILMKDSLSFFFTDDLNGVLYYVWK